MNLPNKLTLARVILIPFFIFFLMTDFFAYSGFAALIIYIAACITDFLDGYIARKNNLVTTFGKFLDPLADKVLVAAALICFVQMQRGDGRSIVSAVPVIIIIFREFLVQGLRLVVVNDGIVVAAGIAGKLKTAFTMCSIVLILFYNALVCAGFVDGYGTAVIIAEQVLIWISALLTVISGMQYVSAYKDYIKQE